MIAIDGGQTSLVNVDLIGKILLEKGLQTVILSEKGLQTVIVPTYTSVNGKRNKRFSISAWKWVPRP